MFVVLAIFACYIRGFDTVIAMASNATIWMRLVEIEEASICYFGIHVPVCTVEIKTSLSTFLFIFTPANCMSRHLQQACLHPGLYTRPNCRSFCFRKEWWRCTYTAALYEHII